MLFSAEERQVMIDSMRDFPAQFAALVRDLSDEDLHTVFIEGEWTVAQNVHHVADAHINAFTRVKLALTEDKPTIKSWDPNTWAETPDSRNLPVASSLAIIEGLHTRWCALWESLTDEQWERVVVGPSGERSNENYLRIYSGHGPAHIDQINKTLAAKGS
jgi:hypothetical protein